MSPRSPSSRKRNKTAPPPSAASHAVVVAALCALILLLCAFDTSLEGSERMLVSYKRNILDDACPATFLAVVAHALFLLVGVGVVAGAEYEHDRARAKGKARQASSRHTKQAQPSTEAVLVKSPTEEAQRTGLVKERTLRRRVRSQPLTAATKDDGKALSDTDCDASSSDSESSDAGESGGCYEGARWQAESVAAAKVAAPQGAAHGVDGARVHRLTEGGNTRAACPDCCTVDRAPDAAGHPQLVERPELPDAFLCPLTLEPMQDPVVTCDGQTYERSAIEQWLRQSSTSPLTGQQLPHLGLAPNVVLRGLIRDLLGMRHENRVGGSGGGGKPGLCAHC